VELYTTQMSQWRKALNKGIPCLDVTVKSGEKTFAPIWDFLMEYKRDQDEVKYTSKFIPLMRKNFKRDKEFWLDTLKQDKLCIMCYCAKGKFCHRLILVDLFEKVCKMHNIPFEYKGEL